MPQFTEWPGNEEAQGHDFTSGCQKNEDGSIVPFEDQDCNLHFPPSFKSFVGEEVNLCRPEQYIREVLFEQKKDQIKKEKRRQIKARKNIRM